jgi:hypothetical protein
MMGSAEAYGFFRSDVVCRAAKYQCEQVRVSWGLPPLALVHFPTEGEITPNPRPLCDDRMATDGIRASGRQHPVQDRHADGSLGLLSRKAAGS